MISAHENIFDSEENKIFNIWKDAPLNDGQLG